MGNGSIGIYMTPDGPKPVEELSREEMLEAIKVIAAHQEYFRQSKTELFALAGLGGRYG